MMALEQLPRKVENPELKRVLRGYFHIYILPLELSIE